MVTTYGAALTDCVNVPTSDDDNEKPVSCSAQSIILTLASAIPHPYCYSPFWQLNATLRQNMRTAVGSNTVVFFVLTGDSMQTAVVTAQRLIAV